MTSVAFWVGIKLKKLDVQCLEDKARELLNSYSIDLNEEKLKNELKI